ncbi:MAG: hypothetical protein BJ554DRAFT_7555 [Olpidium bornovanus]|uniref:Uncharacterized protein n=1 Tax=Olpidium bornovanus TaxID=278681 RepID=A0A8H8DJS2_9FUNG|nr:MAG: hypothetical protein BJ554DRAFT_7555 [Olpidium bornovanus]
MSRSATGGRVCSGITRRRVSDVWTRRGVAATASGRPPRCFGRRCLCQQVSDGACDIGGDAAGLLLFGAALIMRSTRAAEAACIDASGAPGVVRNTDDANYCHVFRPCASRQARKTKKESRSGGRTFPRLSSPPPPLALHPPGVMADGENTNSSYASFPSPWQDQAGGATAAAAAAPAAPAVPAPAAPVGNAPPGGHAGSPRLPTSGYDDAWDAVGRRYEGGLRSAGGAPVALSRLPSSQPLPRHVAVPPEPDLGEYNRASLGDSGSLHSSKGDLAREAAELLKG